MDRTMENGQIWESLARHFAGESTDAEDADLLAWAGEDAPRLAILETSRRAWVAGGSAAERWDADAAWSRLGSGLSRDPVPPPQHDRFARFQPRQESPTGGGLRRMAVAAAIVAIVPGSLIWVVVGQGDGQVVVEELVTPKGERAQMRLSDGTRVDMGPDSRLAIHTQPGGSTREVRLTGEAYFDVAPDPSRPFIVKAGRTVTRVLGTQFDVRAYPTDPGVRVVVGEGSVAFRASGAEEGEGAVLRPGQLGELVSGSHEVSVQKVDPDRYTAWRNGNLAFDDAPLSEVAIELERWYGLPVQIADPSLNSRRLTASFRDQSLDEVIAVVAASLGIEFRKYGNMFTLFPQGRLTTLADSQ